MAKNRPAGASVPNGATRDRKVRGSADEPRRVVLFPTEPTTIPREKIDRAVERVISRKK